MTTPISSFVSTLFGAIKKRRIAQAVLGTGFGGAVAWFVDKLLPHALFPANSYFLVFVVAVPLGVVILISLSKRIVNNLTSVVYKIIRYTGGNDIDKQLEAAITIEYFSYKVNNAVKSFIFIIPITIVFFIFTTDSSVLLAGFGYCGAVVLFLALTHYRVQRGYFGSTRLEAAELIEFIQTQAYEGTPPGSRKVSLPFADRVSAKVREGNTAPEGV